MPDWTALQETGLVRLENALAETALAEIEPLFMRLGRARAGHRLPASDLAGLPSIGVIAATIAPRLGSKVRPVRALLFDKHRGSNWALGWHQDRTIEVSTRVDTPGFGPWTIKAGRQHVAPPIALLQAMVTVRIHLDNVDVDNAPLLVAPGSHRLGLIPEREIESVVSRLGTAICLAKRGDAWLYSTPILHASDAALNPRRRRVLQIDFSGAALPNGLEWAAAA
ncbi:phytanoyl-CoA dioxygenase family protein [Sphingomonas sp. MMS24-J45]|uniref:phytanoyl-CoA dioxygenase family protein n=1 Tax=Sphingomonas sp. MMS24-J45 TaxID=3238806 RepID=UPI00384DCCCB